MNRCPSRDPAARRAEESDISRIRELFKLNYRISYPHPELYSEEWLKHAVGSDDIVARVIDEGGVVAFGALIQDYGDYDHRLGLMGGVVADSERASAGSERGLGTLGERMICDLACEAEARVECVIAEARTKHSLSGRYLERAGLRVAGYLPTYNLIDEKYENLVLYTDLYGEGRKRRSERVPQVVAEVAPLARHVLSVMELPTELEVVSDCQPYAGEFNGTLLPEGKDSLARLRALDRERAGEPFVFDSVSLDYGLPVFDEQRVSYQMAMDAQQAAGGFGYRVDADNQLFKLTDLSGKRPEVVNHLCAGALKVAQRHGARLVEADLSAYDARIQQTFLGHGFRPVAYVPAMAVHDASRLDIVKMLRLEVPYDSAGVRLRAEAREVVSLVERNL